MPKPQVLLHTAPPLLPSHPQTPGSGPSYSQGLSVCLYCSP